MERKGEKAEDRKKKDGDKCGCCCHDGEKPHTKPERAKAGEPDDEDDVIEIRPKPHRPVVPTTQPDKPKPDPKPPVKKPDPPK
jgi:hypothetical protein